MRSLCLVPMLLALSLCAQDVVEVSIAKRGNVRYGPNRDAPVAVTLEIGAKVEVLGRVTNGNDTWYQIRFPREGKAWMHEKNLKARDEGGFVVTEDKVRVRDDATLGANIVAELSAGDVVEDRGQKVGQWHAVFPPKAVAYVHEIVLAMPKAQVVEVEAREAKGDDVDRLWQQARTNFVTFAAVNNLQQALVLDWPGLSRQLATVITDHPKMAARLEAQKFKDGVDAVVREQLRLGAKPAQPVPEPPAAPPVVKSDPVAQPPVQPVQPVPEQPKQDPPSVVEVPATAAPSLEVQQLMGDEAAKVTTSVGAYVAEGFLEQRGADYIVFDNRSQIVAYLKPNGTVQLSDYFWRQIGVKGAIQDTIEVNGARVPVILVDDVTWIQR